MSKTLKRGKQQSKKAETTKKALSKKTRRPRRVKEANEEKPKQPKVQKPKKLPVVDGVRITRVTSRTKGRLVHCHGVDPGGNQITLWVPENKLA